MGSLGYPGIRRDPGWPSSSNFSAERGNQKSCLLLRFHAGAWERGKTTGIPLALCGRFYPTPSKKLHSVHILDLDCLNNLAFHG